jgi:aldehyde dehydrogenase (NAD+)
MSDTPRHKEKIMSGLPTASELERMAFDAADRCGVKLSAPMGVESIKSPINGSPFGSISGAEVVDIDTAVERARRAFEDWRLVPAPVRGALVRRLGDLLSEHKSEIATFISLETGKITSEALGEVQEMIDICDFAVGLSRQLYGRTMSSERPGHRLMETWHPLGVVGVITSFNFPAAVWSWNTAIALVCGDSVIWKPSELAPITAHTCAALLERAVAEVGAPRYVSQVVLGGADAGRALVDHPGVALISATGSTNMGRTVGPRVAARFGRSLLELGGNNASIVASSANLDLALRGIVFGAVGTAGQRCTTLRRAIVHESVVETLVERLAATYGRLVVGNPLRPGTLVGPLIHEAAFTTMSNAIGAARQQGGSLVVGGERLLPDEAPNAYYVNPAIVRMASQTDIMRKETFAPLLYILSYSDFDEAIQLHNDVPQGLSSSIFTSDQAEAERFMSADGSDCGLINVNIGTSGAEIGGAFGGEKETGGGRESGSDAWRSYMRRATNTVNFSGELPLAQGVEFTV